LNTLVESQTLHGSEQDNAITRRRTARREAHAFFTQAYRSFNSALQNVTDSATRAEINNRVSEIRQYIEATAPDFFD
jgi:predicted secreted protein